MLVLTRYTQKRGLSIGILPSFSGYMTVVKIWDYPTERLPKSYRSIHPLNQAWCKQPTGGWR
jgi:hypothetical protein